MTEIQNDPSKMAVGRIFPCRLFLCKNSFTPILHRFGYGFYSTEIKYDRSRENQQIDAKNKSKGVRTGCYCENAKTRINTRVFAGLPH